MKWLLHILLNGVLLGAAAQDMELSGHVKDQHTGEPIPFATVVITGSNIGTTADDAGKFKLQIPEGEKQATLTFQSLGYLSDTLSIAEFQRTKTVLLEPSGGHINEVVVSGTMRSVTKLESPIPVEVYTPALFKKNPAPSLFESLNMVNGVQPQLNCNVCNTGDIHINGLEGPYTMILIDGMPIVSSLSAVYGLHGIPSALVKRIEVVKGPASTLYGSEAVAGLINVITRDAISAPLLKVDISGTTAGEFNADVSAKWKIKKAHSLLGANYFNYWIPRDVNHDNFTDVTLQNRVSVFNKWDFERKDGRPASIAFRYVYENRWGGEMNWTKRWRGTDSIYGESVLTQRAEMFGVYALPIAHEQLRIDYSYNYHFQDSYYGRVKYKAEQHTAFAQLVYDKHWQKVNLLAGVPFRFVYYDDNSVATGNGDSVHPANKPAYTYLPGVFTQVEYKPFTQFTVLAGLRYDYNTTHGNIFTPRLSLRYSPNANHTIRLTGGSGYRVVNLFTEDHAALTGARQVVIAEALKPEQSWNGNLNYNGFFNHKAGFVEVDVSGFYTYFTNQITGDFLSDPNKIIYDNLKGHAISAGISGNFNFSFTNGLTISAGATWLEVYRVQKDSVGNSKSSAQLFAPVVTANFTASYNFSKVGLTFDVTGKVTGPMHLPVVPNDFRPEKSPTYCLLNVQVTKRLPENFEIYMGVKNILNFIPQNPILRPFDPFDKHVTTDNPYGYTFDPSYNYAPIQGVKGFIGMRWTMLTVPEKKK